MLKMRDATGAVLTWAFVCGLTVAQDLPSVTSLPLGDRVSTTDLGPVAETPSEATAAKDRQDLAGGLGDFGGRGGSRSPGYSATWYPARPVSGQATDLGLVRQNLLVGAPLWRGDRDTLILTASVRHSWFDTGALLPDSRRPFPDELWNVSLGLIYTHRFDNGWTAGLMTNYGSASDKPFHGIDEMSVGATTFLRVPVRNERDAWMFSLMYSTASVLNFPIPGIAYAWNPSDDFRITIGLPFSILWRPIEDLTLTASYIPLTNINAYATYQLTERFHIYGGYEFLNESYFLADRADNRDRFMAFEQRLITGVRWDVWRYASLDVHGGYAFERSYGEGHSQGSSLHDEVHVAPGAFLGASLRMRF